MGCGHKCLKTILFLINGLFFLAGAAIVGVALWIRFDKSVEKYANATGLDIATHNLYTAAYILIAFGAFTLVVGFCGCCGAIRDSKCLIGFYIAFVVLILAAEIGAGVFVYVNRDKIVKEIEKAGTDYLKNKYKFNGSDSDQGWTEAMNTLKCCGVNNVSDFSNNTVVPAVCCKNLRDAKSFKFQDCQPDKKIPSCKSKVENLIKEYSIPLIAVGAGVAGFELLVVLMAICFCCNIDGDKDY